MPQHSIRLTQNQIALVNGTQGAVAYKYWYLHGKIPTVLVKVASSTYSSPAGEESMTFQVLSDKELLAWHTTVHEAFFARGKKWAEKHCECPEDGFVTISGYKDWTDWLSWRNGCYKTWGQPQDKWTSLGPLLPVHYIFHHNKSVLVRVPFHPGLLRGAVNDLALYQMTAAYHLPVAFGQAVPTIKTPLPNPIQAK